MFQIARSVTHLVPYRSQTRRRQPRCHGDATNRQTPTLLSFDFKQGGMMEVWYKQDGAGAARRSKIAFLWFNRVWIVCSGATYFVQTGEQKLWFSVTLTSVVLQLLLLMLFTVSVLCFTPWSVEHVFIKRCLKRDAVPSASLLVSVCLCLSLSSYSRHVWGLSLSQIWEQGGDQPVVPVGRPAVHYTTHTHRDTHSLLVRGCLQWLFSFLGD